jgi:hypothetical protein
VDMQKSGTDSKAPNPLCPSTGLKARIGPNEGDAGYLESVGG